MVVVDELLCFMLYVNTDLRREDIVEGLLYPLSLLICLFSLGGFEVENEKRFTQRSPVGEKWITKLPQTRRE